MSHVVQRLTEFVGVDSMCLCDGARVSVAWHGLNAPARVLGEWCIGIATTHMES